MQKALSIRCARKLRPGFMALALALAAFAGHFGPVAAEDSPATVADSAAAQDSGSQDAGPYEQIEVNTGRLVHLAKPAAEIFVANPEIADVQVNAPNTVYVYGRKPGETSIFAATAGGHKELEMHVLVTPNVARLQAGLRSVLPDEPIQVRSLESGIALVGNVSTPEAAANAMAVAKTFLTDKTPILNLLAVHMPSQVNLRVRVAEVSRQVSDQLGISWENVAQTGNFLFGLGTGRDIVNAADTLNAFTRDPNNWSVFGAYRHNNVNINGVIDALQAENLVTILAEPNLTAISGQTASFLAGGEFPIPVDQENNRTTIEFKEFGVRLAFTPTIIDTDRINLRVRPEVSELSDNGAITVQGLRIPALATRRAETTVELGSGQSFVIGGLLQNNVTSGIQSYPGLGKLPVIGALFRSERFQRNESELVIIVTPYIVQPVTAGAFATPIDGYQPTSQRERILKGELYRPSERPGLPAPAQAGGSPRLVGSSGFVVD